MLSMTLRGHSCLGCGCLDHGTQAGRGREGTLGMDVAYPAESRGHLLRKETALLPSEEGQGYGRARDLPPRTEGASGAVAVRPF